MKTTIFNKTKSCTIGKVLQEPCKGYEFELPFGLTGYVDNELGQWGCTEKTTGLFIGKNCNTRVEAINSAINQFNEIGQEVVMKFVNKNKIMNKGYGIFNI